jgi:hypothetical protein
MIDRLSPSNASVTCDDADRDQFLQHILASRIFKKSPRLKAFLIYICEHSFARGFDEISEPQIAVHVSGESRRPAVGVASFRFDVVESPGVV